MNAQNDKEGRCDLSAPYIWAEASNSQPMNTVKSTKPREGKTGIWLGVGAPLRQSLE